MNNPSTNISGVNNSVVVTGNVAGSVSNTHVTNNSQDYYPDEIRDEIDQLLAQQRAQGLDEPAARQGAALKLAEKAKNDDTTMTKLKRWGEYWKTSASAGLIGEAAVEVLKFALKSLGLPVP